MEISRPIVAFLDANVLYPALVRNILMYFAVAKLFRPRWSNVVHMEWMEALRRDRPDLNGQLIKRTYELMITYVNDATVTGYESLIDQLSLPDPNDRHVLAAAIHGGADVIVTSNLRDFPTKTLRPYNIKAQHPDSFLMDIIDRNMDQAMTTLRDMRLQMKMPAVNAADLLENMQRHGLKKTATFLQSRIEQF